MKPIIGLDFGNFNSFVCFIPNFDIDTRLGGNVQDLLSAQQVEGIPSIYFYSKRVGEVLIGENAVRSRAVPIQNRLRYLKRHLGEETTLDGKTISYDQAITEVVQHCIRSANRYLHAGWQVRTNLVSLAYPASFTYAQRQRLIELVEKATLEDGTEIEVFGTIAEPAAAALDYLAEFGKPDEDATVLTYDLGGGTFDLGLVSVYPKGRINDEGNTYYYDIINTRGIHTLGGIEFDDIMFQLLSEKAGVPLNDYTKGILRELAERTKVELSTSTEEWPVIMIGDDYVQMPITRQEFEEASKALLMRTIDETRKILQEHPNQQPDIILLTGGASQMPMVQRELEENFPQYKGKIVYFRPSKAIAYGAARYGIEEENTDPSSKASCVQQRTMYDLGVRFYHNAEDQKGYITTYIPAGTTIPFNGEYKLSYTINEKQRYSTFGVYEANKQYPDGENVYEDYTEIMSVTIDHETLVPFGTESETKLGIDKLNVLTIEAREVDKPWKPPLKNDVQLKNLS